MTVLRIQSGKLLMPCPHCHKTNAVTVERVLEQPICGSCKQPLGPPAAAVEANDSNLRDLLDKSPLPVLLDFWSPNCGPCRTMTPILDQLSRKHAGKFLVVKLDTTQAPLAASGYKISAVPTFVAVRNGREVARRMGAMPPDQLERMALST